MQLFQYERASELMEAANMDVLVAHSGTNVGYLADYRPAATIPSLMMDDGSRYHMMFVGVPKERDKEPFLTPSDDDEEAIRTEGSWIQDRRVYSAAQDLFHTGVDNPVDCLVAALRDRHLEASNIGIEMMQLPVAVFHELQEKLPDALFVDGTQVLRDLRVVKSGEEIARIRRAVQITEQALQIAFDSLRAGMKGTEFYNTMRKSIIDAGGDCLWTFVALGPAGVMKPTEREVRSNEIVWVDTGGFYDGYPCDMARAKILDDPNDKVRRVHQAVLDTNKAVREAIQPGVKCSRLHQLGLQEMERHGFPISLPAVGHGVGRDVHERPFLTASNDSELAAGMVLTVEIQVRESDVGYMNIEDMVLVTKDGCETLTSLDRSLAIR